MEDPVQRAIVDTVIPMSSSLSIHYSNPLDAVVPESEASDDSSQMYSQMSQSMILPSNLNRTKSLMNTSMMAGLNFDERNEDAIPGWEDFA